MTHGSRCHKKEIARRFLAMGRTDMELVYLMIKDQPFVKEGYELAKQTIKEIECTSKQNGVR